MAPQAAHKPLDPFAKKNFELLTKGPQHDLLVMYGSKHAHVHKSMITAVAPNFWALLESKSEKGHDCVVYLNDKAMCNPELIDALLKWVYSEQNYAQAMLAIDDTRYIDEKTRPLMKHLRIAVYATHYKLPALAAEAKAKFDIARHAIKLAHPIPDPRRGVGYYEVLISRSYWTDVLPTEDCAVLRAIQAAGAFVAANRQYIKDPAFEAWLVGMIRMVCKWDITYDWFHKSLDTNLNSFTGKAGIGRFKNGPKAGRWAVLQVKK